MTYWIVFAIVTITEEISDLLLSFWLPFYYEIKIIFLFWLLSPVTRWIIILTYTQSNSWKTPWQSVKREPSDHSDHSL